MSQIDELQARIMEALDRIGRGVEYPYLGWVSAQVEDHRRI